MPSISNPTELRTALVFALVYAVVLLVAAWLHDKAGAAGLYAVALISGLTDVDAITLSALRLFGLGDLVAPQAVTAIGLAFLANIGFKLGLIGASGGMDMLRRCLPGLASTAARHGGWAACVRLRPSALLELRVFSPALETLCALRRPTGDPSKDTQPWKQNVSTQWPTSSPIWSSGSASFGGIFDFDAKRSASPK